MQSLLLLIPISLLLLSVAAFAFRWAVNQKQFEHLEKSALDIFNDDVQPSNEVEPKKDSPCN